jgi:hypothetical protein
MNVYNQKARLQAINVQSILIAELMLEIAQVFP